VAATIPTANVGTTNNKGDCVSERTVTIKVRHLLAVIAGIIGISLWVWQVGEWRVVSYRLAASLVAAFFSGMMIGAPPPEHSK